MSADPLVDLDALIDEARHLPSSPPPGPPGADDPLDALGATLARARRSAREPLALIELLEAAADVAAAPLMATAEPTPIDRLLAQPAASPEAPATTQPSPPRPPQGPEAALGREVLAIMAERPLPGVARAEAIELATRALEEPDRQTLRDLLRVLITGEPASS